MLLINEVIVSFMRSLSFAESKLLLDKYALPLVPTTATRSPRELLVKFAEMRKPAVLKASGPGVMHKTEKGLVFLNLHYNAQIEEAARQIQANVEGDFQFLLQEQLSGAELIVGGKVDNSFGPVVLFGTGGIYAELLDDVSVRVAPLSPEDARQMLWETHAKKFIKGFRSRKMNEEKMISLLLKTSSLMAENPQIKELDFNPVIANEESAVIVDARIIVDR